MQDELYLDNSATTRVSDTVAEKVYKMMVENYGNPSSLHSKGLQAQHSVEDARNTLANALGVTSSEIYFTSGGTEANNLAVIGTALCKRKTGNKIVTSAIEHSSIMDSCKYLETLGFEVVYLPVEKNGAVSVESLENAIDENTILVSLMYVNNETGAIQPVEKIPRIIKRKSSPAVFHIDAVQAFGKLPFKNTKLKADIISVTAHKIYGPKGVGAIYVKKGVRITPRQFGGEQQSKIRPGTESAPLIVGFGEAVKEIDYTKNNDVKEINDYLRERLKELDGVVINSPDNALEYILNFSVVGIRSETMLHFLADRNIYVSSGSACSKGKPSYVLTAMGLDKRLADSAIRVSFSNSNTRADIDKFVEAVNDGINSLVRIRE
ncbi:MAG: cysteine desulfurase family protein [Acutalibacteraceae bacterium]|nr:cysteine desulfurase family protein [Acutalibacteraceae bacterium]